MSIAIENYEMAQKIVQSNNTPIALATYNGTNANIKAVAVVEDDKEVNISQMRKIISKRSAVFKKFPKTKIPYKKTAN